MNSSSRDHDPAADFALEDGALLPCPFCGSSDVLVIRSEDEDGEFAAIGCNDCGAGSRQHYYCGDDAAEYAAGAWNKRAPSRAKQVPGDSSRDEVKPYEAEVGERQP